MTMINTNTNITLKTAVSSGSPFLARILQLHSLWRQRQALKSMDDATLSDIGITREQAKTEAARHVWDAPQFWKQ